MLQVGLGREPGVFAEALVERRQRVETGVVCQVVDRRFDAVVVEAGHHVLQPRLVDVAVEALPEHLVKQVGNLVAAVPAGFRYLLQVQFWVEVGALTLEVMLQVLGHGRQLPRRQAQAAGGGARTAVGVACAVPADQRGVFVDPPDQPVPDGDRLAGLERHQAVAALHRDLILDECGAAIDADAVAVDDVLASFMGQASAYVVAQFLVAEHAVLKEVVVLNIGVVERHDAIEVAMLPAEVVAQHDFGGKRGLLGAVGEGGGDHGWIVHCRTPRCKGVDPAYCTVCSGGLEGKPLILMNVVF